MKEELNCKRIWYRRKRNFLIFGESWMVKIENSAQYMCLACIQKYIHGWKCGVADHTHAIFVFSLLPCSDDFVKRSMLT